MKKLKTFKTFESFMKAYFPKLYKEQKEKEKRDENPGEYDAAQIFKKLEKHFKKIQKIIGEKE